LCIYTRYFQRFMESKDSCRIHKSPRLVPILSQINTVHTTPPYLPKFHFNSIHPLTSSSS
jgi:hypothetical protein